MSLGIVRRRLDSPVFFSSVRICSQRWSPMRSLRSLLTLAAFLVTSVCVPGQSAFLIHGVVLTKDGHPLARVEVSGSAWKRCCPVQYEHTTTDQTGEFTLLHAVPVIHLEKDGLQPLTVVVSGQTELQIGMEPEANSLLLRPCRAPKSGERELGWGQSGLHFTVIKRTVRILGGKPDADYVMYMVKPKKSKSWLELWFGPYAMDWEPDARQFVNSAEFAQRSLVLPDDSVIGIDSWGRFRNGTSWRQADIVGEGARYTDAFPEDAKLFDQIINSACFTPYSPH